MIAMSPNKILIVDDEEDLRDVLTYQLKPLGVQITTAENGRLGLELAKTGDFGAILSDISMPEMNGLEFLAQLREAGFETPFVILTGFGDKAKAVEALRLGAFDFLDKPWEPEMLRQALQSALEHATLLQGLEQELQKAMQENKSIEHLRTMEKSILLMKEYRKQLRQKAG
jgi:DNA-binding NtrC family response regulator